MSTTLLQWGRGFTFVSDDFNIVLTKGVARKRGQLIWRQGKRLRTCIWSVLMGCQLSSDSYVRPRLDTEGMLALGERFQTRETRIHQDDIVDHLSTHPPSPCSSRDIFPCPSRPESPLLLGQLYEDAGFCVDGLDDVVWLRPYQMSKMPRLFVDGISRADVKQGVLGDCWLLSACSAVATHKDLLERVIDPSQPLFGSDYTGMMVLRFWRFGEWIQVCIDDRLPTRNGKLIFASCTHPDEFWLPLLEKAFAKIHGGFYALEGGHAGAALADLTGGIAERLPTTECTFEQLTAIFQHGAFVTCSGNETKGGLVRDHAYTVTAVNAIRLQNGFKVNLVRLRSPWADNVEWKGAWSDGSDEWETVLQEDRQKFYVKTDDGEFWMTFLDFQSRFLEITVATLGPDFDQDGASDKHRQHEILRGVWSEQSSGGSRNNLENFQKNPQYLLRFDSNSSEPINVLIGLMQLPNEKSPLLPIALFLYKTESGAERLKAEYFLCVQEEENSGDFTDCWEVLIRAFLVPGDYVIIPATFQSDSLAEYLLRVFSISPFEITEIENDSS